MTKFTVGAQMYSVRTLLQTEEDMKAAFAQLKAMGYNEVQMSGYNFQIPPELRPASGRFTGISSQNRP